MVSLRALNRALLARQLLLERQPLGLEQAVGRLLAIQAQEPVSPYLALWNRLSGFAPETLDRAFADGRVTKATLLRMTLHATLDSDRALAHQAMQSTLRTRLFDRRVTDFGVTPAQADAVVPVLLAFLSEPRSNAAIEAWLDDRGEPGKAVWRALRTYAPVRHAPTGGPWAFGTRPAYVAAADAPTPFDADTCHDALLRLLRRYLASFGPASIADFAAFAMLHRPPVRAAFDALAGELQVLEGPDGTTLYDLPAADRPPEDVPAPPRLLPMWDSVLLAHADRGRIIPEAYRRVIARSNGDTLATVLVDGFVAGVWRPVEGGIEVTAFERFTRTTWAALATQAADLEDFLGRRERTIHARYHRWFAGLPATAVRVLG